MSKTEIKNILLFCENDYLSECHIRLFAKCLNSRSTDYEYKNTKEYCFNSMKFIFIDLKANWSVNEQQHIILKYKYIDAIIFCLPKDEALLNGWINYTKCFLPQEVIQNASYIIPYQFTRSNQSLELPLNFFKMNSKRLFYFHTKIIESLPFQYRYAEMDWENTRSNCGELMQYLLEQERHLLQITIFGVAIRKFDEFNEILVEICLILTNNILGIQSNSKKSSQSILLEKLVPVKEFIILCEAENCIKQKKLERSERSLAQAYESIRSDFMLQLGNGEECAGHSNIVNWKQSPIFSKPLGTCVKCHCSVTKHRCLPYRKVLACVLKSDDSLTKFTNERDLVLEAIIIYFLYKKQKFNQFLDVFEEIINNKIDSQPYKQLCDIYNKRKMKLEAKHNKVELDFVYKLVDTLKDLQFTGETITKICPGTLHEVYCLTSTVKELQTAPPDLEVIKQSENSKTNREIMESLQGAVQEFKEEFEDLKKICRISEQTMQGSLRAVNELKMEQMALNSQIERCRADKFESNLEIGRRLDFKWKLQRRTSI